MTYYEPQGMHDMAGWEAIDCKQADALRTIPNLVVASAMLDPDGDLGDPVEFTEWWSGDFKLPMLRTYRTPGDGCKHYLGHGSHAARAVEE